MFSILDLDSLISQALLVGDYESAVDLCLHGGRMADAIVIASAGGATLLEKTQKRYFASSNLKMLHVSEMFANFFVSHKILVSHVSTL